MIRFPATHQVCCVLLAVSGFVNLALAQTGTLKPVDEQIQWGDLLTSHDLVWKRLPRNWKQAPFLGNGEQGTML